MYNIRELTIEKYMDKIAAPTFPGPASGSAVATGAAMAAALLEMSCLASLKKKSDEELEKIVLITESLRKICIDLASEDMEKVADLIKNSKSADTAAKEELMKNATEPLINILRRSLEILNLIEKAAPKCIIPVRADLVGGIYLAYAAANASTAGALANLNLIKDSSYNEEVKNIIDEIIGQCSLKKEQLLSALLG